jgi:hypothetical protein
VSKIWLPMWLCRPLSWRFAAPSTRRTASAAAESTPPAIENPNFWSSCAVAMNSWVCASTPTVTRTSTGATTPRSRATASSRAISWNESTHDPPDAGVHGRRQLVEGLVVAVHGDPPGGKPARKRDGELAAAADTSSVRPSLGDPGGRSSHGQGRPSPPPHSAYRRRGPENAALGEPRALERGDMRKSCLL